jgi:NAD(P)-dependent dehydrogenase (short-subunit alcohol dehydrogenase family)
VTSILITGANRGIGLEFARQYAAEGWEVFACCRNPGAAAQLDEIAAANGRLRVTALDVTDSDSIAALARELSDRPLDVLINNAGIIGPTPIPENIGLQHFGSIDYALWERVLRTNTLAPICMAEALLPNLEAGGQKKVVTLSSTVGSLAERDTPAMAYATSKAALNKALRLLAGVLRERGISVGIYCPGYVQTRMDFGGADLTPRESVAGLRRLIDDLRPERSGEFLRYNGERIAW